MLFAGLVWKHPRAADVRVGLSGGGTTSMREVMVAVARRWRDAAERLGAAGGPGFDVTSFNFATMGPVRNGRWTEPDGAAGIAWLQYMAWVETGDRRFLLAADTCLEWLEGFDRNPFYETLLPFGAYLAARMNAEQGRTYDVARLLDWCFGPSDARPGWGVVADRWGGYDVHGLMGSLTDGGGYAFALDPGAGLVAGEWGGREVSGLYRGWRHSTPESAYSLETLVALPFLLPAARSVPDLAPRIASYALHTAANARLFYSEYTRGNESRADLGADVPYERLYRERDGKSPYAAGDFACHKSVYGGSYSLWWGALVHRTEVPHVLRLDVGVTDFLRPIGEPGWLYYNPWDEPKTVRGPAGGLSRCLRAAYGWSGVPERGRGGYPRVRGLAALAHEHREGLQR